MKKIISIFIFIFLIYDSSYAQKYIRLPLLEIQNKEFCSSIYKSVLKSKYFKENYSYGGHLDIGFERCEDDSLNKYYKVTVELKGKKEEILDGSKGYFVISGIKALIYGNYPVPLFIRSGKNRCFKKNNYITIVDGCHIWVFKYINNKMTYWYIDDGFSHYYN